MLGGELFSNYYTHFQIDHEIPRVVFEDLQMQISVKQLVIEK